VGIKWCKCRWGLGVGHLQARVAGMGKKCDRRLVAGISGRMERDLTLAVGVAKMTMRVTN